MPVCRVRLPWVSRATILTFRTPSARVTHPPWRRSRRGVPAVAASHVIDAGAFAEEAALLGPAGAAAEWHLSGVVLAAPAGSTFALGVVRDFDGDGAPDAFAIVRPGAGGDPADPGKLVYYRGQPQSSAPLAPAATFAPPDGLARDANCTPVDRLALVGPNAVLVELGARCPAATTSAPDRYIAILGAGASAIVRFAATLSDPPGAPSLTVDADVSDRDGDGRPDLALRVTLEGGGAPLEPGPRVSAVLAWLDRSAGLSRDAGASEASFRSLASAAAAHAVRAKDVASVPRFVEQVRALWRAACADGAMPRLVGLQGTGAIPCGASRALEELGLAEVRAYTTLGDPFRAAFALDRAENAPASRTATRALEAQSWIAQIAPVAMARPVRGIAAVPALAHGHEVSWGALAFEPGGKLLVRTRAGLVRVDPDAGDEAAADGASDWKSGVTSPDGAMRWIEAYDPCDGVALRATFASGDDVRDVALPVFPPLGDRCAGFRAARRHEHCRFPWESPSGSRRSSRASPYLIAAGSCACLAPWLRCRGRRRSSLGRPLFPRWTNHRRRDVRRAPRPWRRRGASVPRARLRQHLRRATRLCRQQRRRPRRLHPREPRVGRRLEFTLDWSTSWTST